MASRLRGHQPLVPSRQYGRQITHSKYATRQYPQLLLYFTYVIYNGVLTPMLRSKEYLRFSTRRKVLRVPAPVGAQRLTYWLQVPYRNAVPAMAAMAVLH